MVVEITVNLRSRSQMFGKQNPRAFAEASSRTAFLCFVYYCDKKLLVLIRASLFKMHFSKSVVRKHQNSEEFSFQRFTTLQKLEKHSNLLTNFPFEGKSNEL